MSHFVRTLCFVAGLVVMLEASADRPHERASPLNPERVDFVMANFQFTLLHELAHVAIWDLQPPIIGPEEPAADHLATISLLRPVGAPHLGAEKWLEFALTATDAFAISWQLAEKAGAPSPYWDGHALSIQRFYSIACLIYGSDPARFATVPELIQMPAERAGGCGAEYARAVEAMDWLLAFAASKRDGAARATMSVRYEEPRTRTAVHLVAEIKSRTLIEWTLQRFHELIALNEDATLVLRACSVPEAAWIAEKRELVVCYELLEWYYLLGAEQHGETIESLLAQ
jgi:hypothetical protein